MTDFRDLTHLMTPRSVAIVGASDNPSSIGGRTVTNLVTHSDFDGDVFLVNPRRDRIGEHPCYADLTSLPSTPDVVVVAVPAVAVLDTLDEAAAKGAGFAVVLTSGFAEAGSDGQSAEQKMREIAERSGMRIYGPNCPGLVNLSAGLGLTFSPAFADDKEAKGPLGVVTQGGGLGRNIVQAGERGAGIAAWASLGNAVDLDVSDFIHHMASDDAVSVIVTLFEGIRDGDKLQRALDTAAQANKPVVALKIGHSSYGARAVQSHTASMAGSAQVNTTVFAESGVVEVRDIDELADVAWLLSRTDPPARTRIAIVTGSGGAAALAADLVGSAGLELAQLTAESTEHLRAVLPDFAAVGNPVDITAAAISEPGLMKEAVLTVAADPNVDLILMPQALDYGEISRGTAEQMVEIQSHTDVPLLPVWMSDRRGPGWQVLADAGFCAPTSLSKAVSAIRRWAEYGAWRANRAIQPVADHGVRIPGRGHEDSLPALDTEVAAKAWLSQAGIDIPTGTTVSSVDDAADVFTGLQGPVVAKAVSPDIAHKSEAGVVMVGIADPESARQAFNEITRRASQHLPQARIEGVLFEEMIPDDGVEMIVGVHRDPTFGHILTVGLGGIYVEIFHDVQRARLPLTPARAEQLIADLKCYPLLAGARGKTPCDVKGLEELLLTVSDLVTTHGDQVEELDLNPVRVRPRGSAGGSVVALDALVVRSDGDAAPPVSVLGEGARAETQEASG